MLYQNLSSLDDEALNAAIQPVVFLRSMKQYNTDEWSRLMPCCQLIELESGEHLIEPGNNDKTIYFLVKGELDVYPNESSCSSEPVGHIIPGQILGEIAVICNLPRQALVKVADRCKVAQAIGLDYSVFGDIDNLTNISLPTKLIFFRQMLNHTR